MLLLHAATAACVAFPLHQAAIEAIAAACERSGHYLEANKAAVEVIIEELCPYILQP